MDFNTGWTIEVRAKAGTTIPSSTWAFSVIAPPGLRHNDQIGFLHIAQGRTNFGDGGPVSFDLDRNDNTDDFHVFRMAQEPGVNGMGAIYQVWRDGVLLSKLDGDGNPIPNDPLTTARGDLAGLGLRKIAFGDQGGEWLGSSEIDYFRFDTTGAAPLPLTLPGDVNYDGFVDIFDINLVSANWGTPGGPTGDANGGRQRRYFRHQPDSRPTGLLAGRRRRGAGAKHDCVAGAGRLDRYPAARARTEAKLMQIEHPKERIMLNTS